MDKISVSPKLINTLRHSLPDLRRLHARATVSASLSDDVLSAFLASVASRRSALPYAAALFRRMGEPTTFSFNVLIRAHTLSSAPIAALRLFRRLLRSLSLSPDFHSFPFALSACSRLGSSALSLALAAAIHSHAVKLAFTADSFFINSLIKAYSPNLSDARRVFDEFPDRRDVVSHNTLVDALIKSGEILAAREVFDEMPQRDSVSWGTMISGYAQTDRCEEAVRLLHHMLDSGVRPDNVALVSALSACARLGDLERGKRIHYYIDKNGIRYDSFVITALVDFYAKCGFIEEAKRIFDDSKSEKTSVYAWNAMIVGFAIHGRGEDCLACFEAMTKSLGIEPDGVTFVGVLAGCSHSGMVAEARRIFALMESEYKIEREVKHYGCMADVLGRAGLTSAAAEMIARMPMSGDVHVWGGLLGGCRIHGDVEGAAAAARRVVEARADDDGGARSVMAGIYAAEGRWDDVARVGRRCSAAASVLMLSGGGGHEFVAGDTLQRGDMHRIYSILHALERHRREPSSC